MEKNRLKRAWIWFWFNDMTRFLLVLIPSYFALLIPILLYLGIQGEALRKALSLTYGLVLLWAMADNDYTKLKRIGLDVNRRPLKIGAEQQA
jgi:hypothetical protein